LLADSAVGPFWNWRTSPSVTSCTFFVASGRVGLDCLRSTAGVRDPYGRRLMARLVI
jgi:hypothetical protein